MNRDLSRRSASDAKADRDHILEQALKHELRAGAAPLTDGCLDAETLAAWTDGGLGAAAMASTELHVSSCARCQALVATALSLAPGTHLAPSSSAPGTAGMWRWWLAPIAAATAAATLWMVVPEQQPVAPAPFDSARDGARVAQDQPAPAPAAATAPDSTSRAQSRAAAPPAEPVPQTPAAARNALADRAAQDPPPARAREDRAQRQADLSARKEAAPQALPETVPVAGTAAAVAESAPPAAAAAPPVMTLQKRMIAPPLEIVSPDPSSRWRVVTTGLERSEDGGGSWIPIRAASDEAITGGIAVTRNICWLIGRAGLVLVSVDGVTFARVNLPERVDLTAVSATDARSAVITTNDGRRFRTDDSGRTWRLNE